MSVSAPHRSARQPSRGATAFARSAAPLALLCAFGGDPRATDAAADDTAVPAPLVIPRGEGRQDLVVPRDEELAYDISLDFGVLGTPTVGTVTMTAQVSGFRREGVLALSAAPEAEGEQALLVAKAVGQYSLYTVEETVSSLVLPQASPRSIYRSVQTGTENRRREITIGREDERWTSSFRADGHCKGCDDRAHFVKPNWIWQDEHHCAKCKRGEHRIWRDPRAKSVPEDSVDMLGAVMLARSMVRQGRPTASFPLVDSDRLWSVELSRGRRARVGVPAGTFDVVEVLLKVGVPAGEKRKSDDFEGLFGMHGTISIWMHADSGVPVLISGIVPIGPLDLDVTVELTRYRGTPATFRSVASK